jgi:E3 Ubiquitin ligase
VNILGWFLAVVGFVGLLVGLLQMLKMKKMGSVPFRRPSEIAQLGPAAGDAKGMVSTEGHVQPGPQPLVAPMSGEACLAYELTVERKWEKHVRTEKGMQKKTGSDKVFTESKGTLFQVTDGTAGVYVDTSGTIDAHMDKSHSSSMNVSLMVPGTLTFGLMQMNTPHILSHESQTTGFVGTEKIVRPSANVYALGEIQQGAYGPTVATPKGIGTGKLIISHMGRGHLMGKTKRNMILGYALGGVFFVGGGALGVFGPKAEPVASCSTTPMNDALACDDRIFAASGKDLTWTVATAATYRVTVKQPKVKNPIDSTLKISDASGKQVAYNDGGSPGADAKVEQFFAAGTYTVNVSDFSKDTVEGGFGFGLAIEKLATRAPASSADLTSAQVSAKPALPAPPTAKPAPAGKPAAKPATKPAANATKK